MMSDGTNLESNINCIYDTCVYGKGESATGNYRM